jgi:hypothetical protein
MVDFVSILKASLDKQSDTSSPEIRATIYDRARDAVDGFFETRSPRQVYDFRRLLESAIDEIERSYAQLVETTPEAVQPSSSHDAGQVQTGPGTAVETNSETQDTRRTVVTQEAEETPGTPTATEMLDGDNIEAVEIDRRLQNGLRGTHSYQLEWSASTECGICRKWAVCIDSAHCWNRD